MRRQLNLITSLLLIASLCKLADPPDEMHYNKVNKRSGAL